MDEQDKQLAKPGTFPAGNKIAGKRKKSAAKSLRDSANFFHKPKADGKTRTEDVLEKMYQMALKDDGAKDRDKFLKLALGAEKDFARFSQGKAPSNSSGKSEGAGISIVATTVAVSPMPNVPAFIDDKEPEVEEENED